MNSIYVTEGLFMEALHYKRKFLRGTLGSAVRRAACRIGSKAGTIPGLRRALQDWWARVRVEVWVREPGYRTPREAILEKTGPRRWEVGAPWYPEPRTREEWRLAWQLARLLHNLEAYPKLRVGDYAPRFPAVAAWALSHLKWRGIPRDQRMVIRGNTPPTILRAPGYCRLLIVGEEWLWRWLRLQPSEVAALDATRHFERRNHA